MQQTCTKRVKDETQQGWQGHPLGIVQGIVIRVYRICTTQNETHKFLWDFVMQTDDIIASRRPDQVTINKIKGTYRNVDSTVPSDRSINRKESEKKDKYLDFGRELKKQKQQKTAKRESSGDRKSNWHSWYTQQKLVQGLEELKKEEEWRLSVVGTLPILL